MRTTVQWVLCVVYVSMIVTTFGCNSIGVADVASQANQTSGPTDAREEKGGGVKRLAVLLGCLPEYERGKEIIHTLDTLTPSQRESYDSEAFLNETVAFYGGSAPPGGTNDLLIGEGYYLRIVIPTNKDLRPHSAWWSVFVRGKIWQVLPANRIIILEVDEKDWHVGETG